MGIRLSRVPPQRLALARSSFRSGPRFIRPDQTLPTVILNSKDPQRHESSIADSGASADGISETFQLLAASVGTAASALLRGPPQSSLVKRTTAVAADAVLGSHASGPLRLQLRRRLRATVGAIGFGLRLHATLQCLAYLSLSPCDLRTDAEALCSVDSFLGPVVPSSPLMRVTMALASVTAFALKLHSASVWLQHPDSAHGLLVSAASVFDLVASSPDVMGSLKEIHTHIGRHSGRPGSSGCSGGAGGVERAHGSGAGDDDSDGDGGVKC